MTIEQHVEGLRAELRCQSDMELDLDQANLALMLEEQSGEVDAGRDIVGLRVIATAAP